MTSGRVVRSAVGLTAVVVGSLAAVLTWIRQTSRSRTVTEAGELRRSHTALILGAGVLVDGRPSRMLVQRVRAGADLFHAGIVTQLLLSGDGAGSRGHDEVAVMAALAAEFGVPASAVLGDRLGLSTRESCVHARTELGSVPIVVVTQAFHARRAAFLAGRARLDAETLALPDREVYGRRVVAPLIAREWLACVKALVETR